jgi:iron-sulfur cluster repair protein YtfE (RIC family)
MTIFSILAAGLLFGATCSHAQTDTHAHPSSASEPANGLQIPKSMQTEHETLHSDLVKLTKAGGQTGEAAQKVAKDLDHHFQKENEFALPPLGLLVPLSEGKFDCGMTAILAMTNKLQADLPTMLAEHKEIKAALSELKNAATSENKTEGIRFADELAAHAQTEEQVTYPTAILIGLYVKGKAAQPLTAVATTETLCPGKSPDLPLPSGPRMEPVMRKTGDAKSSGDRMS